MGILTSFRTLVATLALLGLLTACGSSGHTSSPPTSAPSTTGTVASSAELCSARDALKTSIQDLANVDVIKNGTSSLDAALTKVKDNLQAVRSAAHGQLDPQVTALQNAIDQLGNAISNLGSGGGVSDVLTAAGNVAHAGSNLLDSMSNLKCR